MPTKKPNLGDQYRCPKGQLGRLVAKRMNLHHEKLTLWGLTKVTLRSDYVILDVGCGGGKTIGKLAQMTPNGKIFGIDYSPDMVEFSKEINKRLITEDQVEIIEESVEKMSFKDNFFDLVTAFETYYFWANFPLALREIKRVLKSGGRLLLVNEMLYGVTPAKIIEETHVRLFPLDEIQKVLKSIGFVDIQTFNKPETEWNAILAQK
ncbi:MAG TPA: class I SAM-dependent methyltransferase [Candidatus Acidoferrum sp.]|nr:class I SAM-dependent methyltransferase [Candidatus Acidoferrum sp.]